MKIALAHDHLFQIGGAERVLRELHDLYPNAPIYTLIYTLNNFPFFKNVKVFTSFLQQMPGGHSFFKLYLRLMPLAWEQFDFSDYDVVISSSSAFVKGIITSPHTIHISYCHTPTRYLWSDRVEYIRDLRIPKVFKLYLMSLLDHLRLWDQRAASRVDYFIANSNFVAQRIKKYYQRDSIVIYPPVDTRSFFVSKNIDNYYLLVSRLRPYKKVDIAISAFNQLRLPLIIIGAGEEYSYLKKMAKHNITFLGEVSDNVRNKYLSQCKAFIHPQEEDCGISVVEAMASGRPVIAYRSGGALETIVDNVTGCFFDEQCSEALAYAVLKFNHAMYDPKFIRSHALTFDSSIFKSKIQTLVQTILHNNKQ